METYYGDGDDDGGDPTLTIITVLMVAAIIGFAVFVVIKKRQADAMMQAPLLPNVVEPVQN